MKNILTTLLGCLFLLTACDDVIELDVHSGKDALVVDGWITNNPGPHYVKLFKTVRYFDTPDFPAVQNATLTLTDDLGNQEILTEVTPGKYEIKNIAGVVGRTYTLDIITTDGTYKAVTKLQRLGLPVDSVVFTYKKKSAVVEDEGFYPGMFGQELAGKGDFLMVKMRRNEQEMKSGEDINLLSDQYIDGNYVFDGRLNVQKPFQADDQVRFEFWSLSEDAYRFWEDIRVQLNNEGLFAVPSTNTRTNIKKVTPQAMDVVGYFGASEVQVLQANVK